MTANMYWQTEKIVRYTHLNSAGTLFGGKAMSWIDEQSAIYAGKQMGTGRLVTAKISEIVFNAPVVNGDIIAIGVDLVRVGRTSVTVQCKIKNISTDKIVVDVAELVFVALDAEGKPTQHKLSKK